MNEIFTIILNHYVVIEEDPIINEGVLFFISSTLSVIFNID